MNQSAPTPCVLLVEDDASITRFVSMALEILPIRLLTCTSVAGAVTLLQQHDVKLVITDLMLPGESGLSLVQRLHADPQLRQNTLIAVFSAGLTPAVKEQLQGLSLWRTLSKPIAVQELESCVTDALALQSPQAAASLSIQPQATAHSPAEALAITTHFGGDAKLFTAYRSACLRQFSADVKTGDLAATSEDWPALRRLAHSLATVLLTIGRPEDSLVARALEDAAEQNLRSECQGGWADLRARLQNGIT